MIYLDNNATTKIDDRVLEAMLPYLKEDYGNASSIQHKMGRKANQAIEAARNQIAVFLKASPKEIVFTSGSTEAINFVMKGIFTRYQSKGKHIITARTEHKAVLSVCEYLQKQGAEITYLQVNEDGQIDLQKLKESIRTDTILVSLMSANNETGVQHPIEVISTICQEKDVLFFCDATQSIGKSTINLVKTGVDIFCFSAHKFHGPKGIGTIYIKRKSKPIQIEPLITGGKQENSLRGGTYQTANIVGMATALQQSLLTNHQQIESLRDYFEQQIIKEIEDTKIHAKSTIRIGNTSNVLFKHTRSQEIMTKINELAISSGSACVSGDRDPSHVLTAMDIQQEDALCSLRFSLSKYNTKEDIDQTIQFLKSAVKNIRSSSPIWQMYKDGLIA